ncbi:MULTISPECIES: peptidoglycan-binding domain-containing protein [unclassified Streptomyces]|uniref:peptidoglycan-binding domain-containing protein n=1 Tax=unclassified Streptomyces TaxID=2593676 RepID=UPI00344E00C6
MGGTSGAGAVTGSGADLSTGSSPGSRTGADSPTGADPRTGAGTGGADSRTGSGPVSRTGSGPGSGAHPAADESRRRTATMGAGPGFGAGPAFGLGPGASDLVQPRRRRPFAALAVGVAVAAVIGTAAFAGGLLGGDGSQDEALPEATTSVPDAEDEPAASVAPSPSASAPPSRTASASPTPSASASPSASTSASPSESAEPGPATSAPAAPAPGTPSASASGSPAPPPPAPPAELAPSSLRRGDQGPQVAELQNRLGEVWLYHGDADGNFDDRVENAVRIYQSYKAIQGDPAGVYGPNTRSALEAETTGRGRG